MAITTPTKAQFAKELLRLLGLEGRNVQKLVITADPDLTRVEITELFINSDEVEPVTRTFRLVEGD